MGGARVGDDDREILKLLTRIDDDIKIWPTSRCRGRIPNFFVLLFLLSLPLSTIDRHWWFVDYLYA